MSFQLYGIGFVAVGTDSKLGQLLVNAVTGQVPNGGPATVKLFMDLWDKKK
jgi:hypothetical protein